jgi:hypothetical protein
MVEKTNIGKKACQDFSPKKDNYKLLKEEIVLQSMQQ